MTTTPAPPSRAPKRPARSGRWRVSEAAGSWALASQLVLIDRAPHVASAKAVWSAFRLEDAFRYRWEAVDPRPRVQQRYDAILGLETAAPLVSMRTRRDRAMARDRSQRGFRLVDVNMGPGRRTSNSLQVAVAVDASLAGAPATALDWRSHRDPVRLHDVASLPEAQAAVRVDGEAEARRVVASWGPGAKGIVSVRDPSHAHHRVINAWNSDGLVEFFDYSSRSVPPKGKAEAAERAREVLACIDTDSPFANVMLWRSADIPGGCRLPDDWLQLPGALARRRFAAAVGEEMPDAVLDEAIARARFFADRRYTNRLVESLRRGECTFSATTMANLGSSEAPAALTAMDHAVEVLANHGELRVIGGAIECTVVDTDDTRAAAALFGQVVAWRSRLDGVPEGSVEYRVTAEQWQRIDVDDPRDVSPPRSTDAGPTESTRQRQTSWIDVNRAFSPGQRRTNCWNCAAAVANWVRTAAPSTGLPVYREAPFRPTIPEFLAMVGSVASATYLDDQTREAADAIARAWGPSGHGLVVASLTDSSTHIFNVVVAADGVATRYLDGHTGTDGVSNFDNPWLRIGMVQLSGTVASAHRFDGTSSTVAGRAPAPEPAGR